MKRKVGDRVKVKSLEWYEKNKDIKGDVSIVPHDFVENMRKYCGLEGKVVDIGGDNYTLSIDNLIVEGWVFTDEMLEDTETEQIDTPTNIIQTTQINSPDYYNNYSVEVVEMARRIWGDEAMKTAAEITAFIYRMRAGVKPDNEIETDLAKEKWWLNYKKDLK